MGHAYFLCDGYRFEITDVRLRNGAFVMTGRTEVSPGARVQVNGPVTVFGEDGRGCFQGGTLTLDSSAGPFGGVVATTLTMTMEKVHDRSAPVERRVSDLDTRQRPVLREVAPKRKRIREVIMRVRLFWGRRK